MTQVFALSRPIDGLARSAARLKLHAAALWCAYPREIMGVGVLAAICAGALMLSGAQHRPTPRLSVPPPAPPPMVVRPLAPEQALKLNAEIPVAGGANPASLPFVFKGNAAARAQALNCLASAVYYEAGNQDEDGARAIAQVVLNRVRHPAFPASICGVVYQGSTRLTGCQFTFTCDGSLNRRPDLEGWNRALRLAEAALAGSVYVPVGWATHYHADYVVPYWASTMAKNAVVGAHLFYRWAGAWGQPAVFTKLYAGREPSADALRLAALAAVHVAPTQSGSLAAAIKDIPGAEPLKLAPSMRGDKRVAVRFNLIARTAAEKAPHEDYSNKFAASDNLKWALSSNSAADNQQPLGRPAASPALAGAASQR
jgi:spore germination cell wall hydrolase CwlJ-like protein